MLPFTERCHGVDFFAFCKSMRVCIKQMFSLVNIDWRI